MLRAFGVFCLLVPLIVAGAWLAMQHIPDWYVPPAIAPEDYQRVRDDVEAVFNEISENLMGSKPFVLLLNDEQVNNWMAVRGHMLPEAERWLPDFIEDPMIRFEDDTVTVAGTATRGSVQSVVSLTWRFDIRPDTIVARLHRTRSGSLPLPAALIGRGLDSFSADSGSGPVPVFGDDLDLAGHVTQAGTGLEIENRFRWKNGDRLFRITGLQSKNGVARFEIEPLEHR
ncbi:MAG: hypothetical protein JSU68_09410 [Phycisphaerales bacterium]|nr:MAG: hypothetical protein JSU68_09410 [Phycisphaerales bacterium]